MKYICHRNYNGVTTSANKMNIKRGEKFTVIANFIATNDGKAICSVSSNVAHKHFAINDDGKGLERGALTFRIAYDDRDGGNGFRFSDAEIDLITKEYKRFLKEKGAIIFNADFFNANVDELADMLNKLDLVRGESKCIKL